jgi:hypothetical protein
MGGSIMKKYLLPMLILGLFSAFSVCFAQEIPNIDPDAMKIMQQYQQQSRNVPPEILGLMPPGLPLTQKEWSVEVTQKMLFQADLVANIGSTKLENTEGYTLDMRVLATAYNMNSIGGKMTADQTLTTQRQEVQDNWTKIHTAKKDRHITYSQPEKIVVPGGYILTQKIYYAAHDEGEGRVPERTEYCGFLYMELESGWLWAEVQPVPNTKAGIEKWLKHTAAAASKLEVKKYFK